MTIRVPEACATMSMALNSNGYEPHYESLKFASLVSSKTVRLHPLPPPPKTTFSLKVTVVDDGDHPIKDATVRVFRKPAAADYLEPAGEGVSKADGVVPFEVSGGNVVLSGFDTLGGRFGVLSLSVTADQSVRLVLSDKGTAKAVSVRVVNANSQEAERDVSLRFFVGNVLLTTGISDAKGVFFQQVMVPSDAGDLSVVAIKPGFVTRVQRMSFVDIKNPQATLVTLSPLTQSNAGAIDALVADASTGLGIRDALVNVYAAPASQTPPATLSETRTESVTLRLAAAVKVPLLAAPVATGADGHALIERLPPGLVDVTFARVGFVDATKQNAEIRSGQVTAVRADLVHAIGSIRVRVTDAKTGSLIEDADVNAYDAASGNRITGPVRTVAGIAVFSGLDVTKAVYFRIGKDGFVPRTTQQFYAPLQRERIITVPLTQEGTAHLDFQTGPVYLADRTTVAHALEAGKSYWIPFSMTLSGRPSFGQVQTFVQDSQTDLRIENADGPLVAVWTRLSHATTADGFADTSATLVDAAHPTARQLSQFWGTMAMGQYDFWVKVSLPLNAKPKQSLRFGIRTQDAAGTGFDSQVNSREYTLQQPLCASGCGDDAFLWDVFVAPQGAAFAQATLLSDISGTMVPLSAASAD
jgi:hypothetical protein